MSAENAPAPEPAKSTPNVTRYTLNAENITHFTPKSFEDEAAALAIENEPIKIINKRRLGREALLSMRIDYGPRRNPATLSREELNNLPLETLHDYITQDIPENRVSETEYDEQYLENASDRDLESVIDYYANELDEHLTTYREKNRRNRAGQNAWTRAIDKQENGTAKKPAPNTPTPTPVTTPSPAKVAAAIRKKPAPTAPKPEPKTTEAPAKTPEKKKPKSRTLSGADWAIQQIMNEHTAKTK